jgi:hypothetical protein
MNKAKGKDKIYMGCRCYERLQPNTKEFKGLGYTKFVLRNSLWQASTFPFASNLEKARRNVKDGRILCAAVVWSSCSVSREMRPARVRVLLISANRPTSRRRNLKDGKRMFDTVVNVLIPVRFLWRCYLLGSGSFWSVHWLYKSESQSRIRNSHSVERCKTVQHRVHMCRLWQWTWLLRLYANVSAVQRLGDKHRGSPMVTGDLCVSWWG